MSVEVQLASVSSQLMLVVGPLNLAAVYLRLAGVNCRQLGPTDVGSRLTDGVSNGYVKRVSIGVCHPEQNTKIKPVPYGRSYTFLCLSQTRHVTDTHDSTIDNCQETVPQGFVTRVYCGEAVVVNISVRFHLSEMRSIVGHMLDSSYLGNLTTNDKANGWLIID